MRNKSERGSSYMSFLRRRLLQKNSESPKNSAKASPPSLQRPTERRLRVINLKTATAWKADPYRGLDKKEAVQKAEKRLCEERSDEAIR